MHLQNTHVDNGTELHDLALQFFQTMEFEVDEQITLIGSSGKKHQFDMVIKSDSEMEVSEILVKIVDWKRAVGVDRLIRFERILKDLNNKKGMVVSNFFSEPAVKYAKKHGLIIYERKHLQLPTDLRNSQVLPALLLVVPH